MEAPEWALTVWRDPVTNVRTAALEALARLKTPMTLAIDPSGAATRPEDSVPAVVHIAIDALATATDYQLLRAAAMALRGTPQAHRDKVTEVLLVALRRLTDTADDTSRDPRVAILDRLGELMPPERSGDLLPYTADFDDEVVAAAGKAFATLVGTLPAQAVRQRRYPYQPTEDELQSLPRTMEIVLDSGMVTIGLLPSVAPVTIARVAALVRAGHYTGLTFHRIVPNFVVQGGSPGANEYVGVSRYMRDEPGLAPHVRGAVGISTRGRDTGDAQLFIDLVDVPRLDRDYTVIGYVVAPGMEFIDRLLEGATIKSISVK
jgi:cyclophilin family peptidyl-prolyl cis-trans isomerase